MAPFLVVFGFIPGILAGVGGGWVHPGGMMGKGLEHQCWGSTDRPFPRREVPEPQLERHVPHHSRSLSVKAAILEKVGQARRVQRAKQLAEKHRLSQKALQRQNRTCQRPLRRAKQHIGTFVHQPCQRHCNY